jgi:hypothetical protein
VSWLLRRRFRALLVALVLLLAVYPLLRGIFAARVLFDALLTLVFVSALFATFSRHSTRLASLLLGVPTLLGQWTGYVLPGLPQEPLAIAFHLLAAAFLGFVVAAILRMVYSEEAVSADGVAGAFCGYLLVGAAFGHLYCVVETLAPGSYAGGEGFTAQLRDEGRRSFVLTYFSFMTLTTVGYGDVTPASDTAKGLATVEAVAGQFYIAVLVAELIGKRVSQVISRGPPGPPG